MAMEKISEHTYLFPAYGRVYTEADKAKSDFLEGKDFKIRRGPYCSIRDFRSGTTVTIFYGPTYQRDVKVTVP